MTARLGSLQRSWRRTRRQPLSVRLLRRMERLPLSERQIEVSSTCSRSPHGAQRNAGASVQFAIPLPGFRLATTRYGLFTAIFVNNCDFL